MGRWIGTNWRRNFGPFESLTSLTHLFPTLCFVSLSLSHLLPLFSWRGPALQKVYVRGQNVPCQVMDIHTSHLPFIPPSTSVSLSSPSSSPCLPVSHSHPCLPFLFPLSSPGVNVLFPTVLAVPSHCLSHPSCNYGNQRATMLGNSLCLHKKRYLFSQQSRAVGQTCCSIISICYNVISSAAFSDS